MSGIHRAPTRAEQVTLGTRIEVRARFDLLPETVPAIRYFHHRVARIGVAIESHMEGGEIVLAYRLSVADAIELGYTYHGTDDLFLALVSTYPALHPTPAALRRRIAELEEEYSWMKRIAS